jgi:hypothetical protein
MCAFQRRLCPRSCFCDFPTPLRLLRLLLSLLCFLPIRRPCRLSISLSRFCRSHTTPCCRVVSFRSSDFLRRYSWSRKEERSALVEDNVVPNTLNNVSMGFQNNHIELAATDDIERLPELDKIDGGFRNCIRFDIRELIRLNVILIDHFIVVTRLPAASDPGGAFEQPARVYERYRYRNT